MRNFFLALILVVGIGLAGPASAQSEADPAALREAHTLIDRIGMDGLMKQQLGAIQEQVNAMLKSAGPDKDLEEVMNKYIRLASEQIMARLPKYLDEVALIYTRNFALDELKAMNAFYESPLGQKLLQKTPALLKECNEASQHMGVDVMQEVWKQMGPDIERARAKAQRK
jgi:hypothetical protein